jgi:drug/metabolite transporter (DMT)-like permease
VFESRPPTSSTSSHRNALLQALLVTVLWSSSWVIIRFGLDREGLSPLTFAGLRYGTGALILWFVSLATAASRARVSVDGAAVLRLAALGIVMYSLTQGAQFVALDHQPAATTSLLLSMTPLVVAMLAGAFLREQPTAAQFGGAALVAVGAGLYFGGALGATTAGMAAAVVGLLANAVASLLGRAENRRRDTTPLATTVVSMTVGSVILLAVGLAIEGPPEITGRSAVMVSWLGVVNTAFAFTLWNHTLQRLSATESAVVNNTMLIQIAVLAWVFLDEAPSAIQLIGIALVTAGIAVATRPIPVRRRGR